MKNGVLKQVTELQRLSYSELEERWRDLYGTEPAAFNRLLREVERGRIDVTVVYKVDRLSRSLLDFAKIVEIFERHGVSFVSVTQQFNTTTSMGRLTLNILLSFAQFEREIIGERIRDKIAAAKRKGKYTGGMPILGYDVDRPNKRLIVNAEEAELVRHIFKRFCQLGSATRLADKLKEQGRRTKAWTTKKGKVAGGRPWNKGQLHRLLNNRKYIGEIEHKGAIYPGEHDPIVPRALWDDAHKILAENRAVRSNRTRAKTPALLKGILRCGHCGGAMGPRSASSASTRRRQRDERRPDCRAHRWQKLLDEGRYTSITALAEALDVDRSHVSRMLRLTLLAPDIIEAILRGDEPSGLSLAKLTGRLPVLWSEQREKLGFPRR